MSMRARLYRALTTPLPMILKQLVTKRDLARRFPGTLLSPRSDIPQGRVSIGRGTYGRPTVRLFRETDALTIGRYCSIGPDVVFIAGGEHDLTLPTTYPFRSKTIGRDVDGISRGPITIGNDVWIGAQATILSGVTIGDGAVIGARSVVTRDVPAFGVAVGNPARVRRIRYTEEQRAALSAIAWWDWPEATIRERMDDFYLPVDAFIAKYAP